MTSTSLASSRVAHRAAALLGVALAAACAPSPPPPAAPVVVVTPRPAVADGSAPPVKVASSIRSSPELLALCDPRRSVAKPRAMLVVEIQTLETLLAQTPKEAPERPRIVERLARTYADLARVAASDRDAFQRQPGAEAESKKAEVVRRAAQQASAKRYMLLAEEHPMWCATPNAADAPPNAACEGEAWYFAGLAFEELGLFDQALKAYLRVAQTGELTRFVPYAYIRFGERFVADASTDPSRWELAEQAFQKAAQFPAPGNDMLGYALLRLGQIRLQRGDRDGAHAFFQRLRDLAAAGAPPANGTYGAGVTAIAARLVPPDA